MDKVNEIMTDSYGEIRITDRKKISLTGIKKLVSFNPEEFLMETRLGLLLLKGNNLEIIKLDTLEGILTIKGIINFLNYVESSNKKESSLLAKLFK